MMKTKILLFLMAWPIAVTSVTAEDFLVRDGKANAEIIISTGASRSTHLAVQELQHYVKKITGATLPSGTNPTIGFPVKIYIGESLHTEKLGISAKEVKDGAYRIVSGDQWLVLIGDDTDFTPSEPWPRGYQDIRSGKMQAEWDKVSGEHWGYPHSQLHKHYSGSNSLFGTPDEQKVDRDGNVNVWNFDERGSFNAVCGFLRDLGVRWYMPGEIGEILPETDSIALPKIDKTVHPDFPMRILNFRPAVYGRDAMMWAFRLGERHPYGRQAAHGLDHMTHNDYYLENKPEWFALYGGKRHTEKGQRLNQLCYSSEDLFENAVRFARTQFDHFNMNAVSIMPPDGYTSICQCQLCEGKDQPDRGNRGALSNYVWDFVNRVAKEVGKTHPDKLISNCAYGIYTDPPTNIKKLEPNVQVIIVGGRRPTRDKPEERAELRELRAGWAKLTDRPVEIFENYPFTGRNFYLPAYIPKVMGQSINETKGASRGEDIWLTMDFKENAIGFNHFLIYFTARMYWGGKDQDPMELFNEYCEKFYGPAAGNMKQFFTYCEENWREMEFDSDKAQQALSSFEKAKSAASPDSIYGQRLALIDNYLNGLRRKSIQLSQKRGPVPKLRFVGGEPLEPIVIDGKLDDKAWREIPVASTGTMRELQTGRLPTYGTSIKTTWQSGGLYFAVRCEEAPGDKPTIATTKDGDQATWYGDVVEFLINTDSHNYYQIAVNPAGAIINLDRAAEKSKWDSWTSKAEVATQIAGDHWTVEIRIPVTTDENDPLHLVIGRKPTQSLPWYVNVCRQRIRGKDTELSAFSPTGKSGFHEPMKFAHLYLGLSHQFEADPDVSDYLIEERKADQLYRNGKREEALAAYVSLADIKDLTDLQKSDALSQAVSSARSLKNIALAEELSLKIPIDEISKTAQMENLLEQRKSADIVEQFGAEDFKKWPFPHIGPAAYARGRAYFYQKDGPRADADLQLALVMTPDPRTRDAIERTMGNNRESVLKDDDSALEAYSNLIDRAGKNNGSSDYFYSLQGAARILTRQGKFDEAIATLDHVETGKLQGVWKGYLLLSRAESLLAAGRNDEARKVLDTIKLDQTTSKSHQERAAELIKEITN